jgi:hypothetical protein
VSSETNKRLARAFMKVFGGLVFRIPSDPSDFLTTLQADLGHDTTGRLGEISMPTLVIGGTEDPFSSEANLREIAGKIPDVALRLYEGVGHGVPKERKRRYEDDTLAFLSRSCTIPLGVCPAKVSRRCPRERRRWDEAVSRGIGSCFGIRGFLRRAGTKGRTDAA